MNLSISEFKPALFISLKRYTVKKLFSDLMAGVIVGIVAMPLAIAFGIASGVTPQQGLITAIIGGFIVSLLGGCNVQIGGPTGAFIIIVSGIVQVYGFQGLAVATIMAGIMLLLMGVFKLGTIIRYIPYPVVIGFTGGIALTIFTTQIQDFTGMHIADVPADFFSKWGAYMQNIDTSDIATVILGVASLAIIIFTPKIVSRIPGPLAAILIITVISYILRNYFGLTGIETIGDRFVISGDIKAQDGFNFDMETINMLLIPAFTIAMLGAIESLLSATVADGVTGDRHNSNTELIAQGAANIVSPLFGGIPVTGAIARTMTNINNGGKTPVSGIIHSIVLLLILFFLAPLTVYIPMTCLAAVLIVVSYNMSGWKTIRSISKNRNADVAVLWATLLLTVIFNLNIAIEIGLLLAIILFIKRVTENVHVSVFRKELDLAEKERSTSTLEEDHLTLEHGVEVYEIDGPFFFGIANKFDEQMRAVGDKSRVRILRMRNVPFIDTTGIHNLEIFLQSSNKAKIDVILSGVNPSVFATLEKSGITEYIKEENICDNIRSAVALANKIVADK